MDKSYKIRKYRRKDYSTVVEFPVEIIGRDGVVRRYSFEESVRLYQRRIASADVRYADTDLIQAEKRHCFNRIQQLRRSFFARYGWPAVSTVDEEGCSRPIAAEVAAFLRRCMASAGQRVEDFRFCKLEQTENYRIFFVQPPGEAPDMDTVVEDHFLLYVFDFTVQGASPEREAFFDMIKMLEGVKLSAHGSIETLVAFFHTHDCGLILTGSGSLAKTVQQIGSEEQNSLPWVHETDQIDPVEKGMRLLAQGRLEPAMSAFVSAYSEQHFRRVAYLGAAVVADQLSCDDEAETATVMGSRYFPGDPALIFHRGLNLIRKGDYRLARAHLEQILDWPYGKGATQFLIGLCLLADGFHLQGQAKLRRVASYTFRLDPHLAKGVRWVRAQLWARNLLLVGAGFFVLVGIIGLYTGVWWKAALIPAGGIAAVMVGRSWKRQLIAQLCGPPDQRMRLSSSAVLMSEDPQHPA